MSRIRPHLSLFRNKESGDFVLHNFAINPDIGASTSCGSSVTVPDSVMRMQGRELVLQNLREFHRRQPSPSAFTKLTRKEKAGFYALHDLVSIDQMDRDQLRLTPMHRVSAIGFEGAIDGAEDVIIPADASEHFFYAELLIAFRRSSKVLP